MAVLRYDVDVDTRRAEQRIGAFAAGMRGRISAAVRALPEIEIGADSTDAQRELARIRQEMVALGRQRIGVDIDAAAAQTRLAELTTQLQALQASDDIQINADVEAALAGLGVVAAAVEDLDGRTARVKVEVDRSFADAIVKVAALGRALTQIALPAAALAAVPTILAIGAAATTAAGSLWLLPAAAAVAAAAVGTLVVGLQGFSEAMKQRGDPEKFAEAIAKLSPAARDAAVTVRDLGGAWSEMQRHVQQHLFAGVSGQIRELSDRYLPVLNSGLSGIATELNRGATMWAEWAKSGPAVANLTTILGNTRNTMRELAPAGVNVAAALSTIAVVGSEIMPELAAGATAATGRFREFVAEARRTGEMEQWIRGGLDALGQLGQVAGNTGGILGGMFSAAEAAGADFLDSAVRITGALDDLVNSTRGQNELTTVLRESQAAIDALMPGVQDLTSAVLGMLGGFASTQGLQTFTALLSDAASVASPLIERLGTLGGETLGNLADGARFAVGALTPIAGLLGGIVDGLGPVVPLAVAAVIAFKGMAVLTPVLAGVAGSAGVAAAAFTAMFAAMGTAAGVGAAVTGAVLGFARTLPLIGAAAIGVGAAMDAFSVSTADAATVMAAGGRAAENMTQKLRDQAGASDTGIGWMNRLNVAVNEWIYSTFTGIGTVESATEAAARQRAEMTSLQRAQQDVTVAQNEYQIALDTFGANAPQTVAAAANLATATDRVEVEQRAAADATKSHTDRMVEQADQALAAVNASRGYEGALLNLERAQRQAADATAQHGADSLEAREANFALEGQMFATAEAAGEKARADAEATGATNGAEIASRAHKEELIRLAGQATGPTRDALLNAAAAMGDLSTAASIAEDRTRAQKDELSRLAGQATGPTATALRNLSGNFDTLGGANANARDRALLQIEALKGIAATASGPLRTELDRMIRQIQSIPDGRFTVTADGRIGVLNSVGPGGRPIRWDGGGHTGGIVGQGGPGGVMPNVGRDRFAAGGVLPGYTPGRDPHLFVSQTGLKIGLSGGEAVMRPEWTRAVGPAYVAQANAAARQGGIDGVKRFVTSRTEKGVDSAHFARGGIVGGRDLGRFAPGGIVRSGTQPYERGVHEVYNKLNADVSARLTETVQARIRAMEAAARARAAAAGAIGSAGGGGGWQWQMRVLRQRFPGLPLNSGYRPGAITATGNPSYHGRGRAVDVPPRMDVFNWIRGIYGANTKELIFSPAGGRQLNNGRPHVYTGVTKRMHYDHVHWAYRNGGILPSRRGPGMKLADRGGMFASGTAALNLSGRAERALTGRQNDAFEQLVGAITGDRVDMASQIRDRPMPGVRVDVERMVAAVQRSAASNAAQLGLLTALLRDRPQQVITQNIDGSRSPVETGYTAALALKLHR